MTKDALNDADIEVESARDGARDLWTRIAVTLAALTAVGSLRWVPLPCVDLFQIEELGLSRSFAVGGLGMAPWMSGMLLVEFVVMLVPRWRARRDDGPEAREPLRRAGLRVGFALAAIQTIGLTLWINGTGLSTATNALELSQQAVAIYAGSCATLLAASVVSSRGIGDGIALLFLFEHGFSLWLSWRLDSTAYDARALVPAGLTCLAIAAVLTRLRSARLPGPVSGIGGMTWAFSLLAMPASIAALTLEHVSVPSASPPAWVVVPCVAILTGGAALLFTPPRAAISALLRAGAVPDAPAARREYARGWLAAVCGVSALAYVTWDSPLGALMAWIVPATAYLIDVVGEVRFRSEHGRCFIVDELHRPYLLAERIASLPENTQVFARSLSFRSLLQFLGPYVPVLLLVPERETPSVAVLESDASAAPTPDADAE